VEEVYLPVVGTSAGVSTADTTAQADVPQGSSSGNPAGPTSEASAPDLMPTTASPSVPKLTALSEPDVQPVTEVAEVPTAEVTTEIRAAPAATIVPPTIVTAPTVPVIQHRDPLSRLAPAIPVVQALPSAPSPSVLNLGEGKLSSKGLSCMFCRRTPITGIVPALALGAAAELLVRVSAPLIKWLRISASPS